MLPHLKMKTLDPIRLLKRIKNKGWMPSFILKAFSFFLVLHMMTSFFHILTVIPLMSTFSFMSRVAMFLSGVKLIVASLLFLYKRNSTNLGNHKTFLLSVCFLIVHFYVVIFVMEPNLCLGSFVSPNSLILLHYSLKIFTGQLQKVSIIVAIFGICCWKFTTYETYNLEILSFYGIVLLVFWRDQIKNKPIEVKKVKERVKTMSSIREKPNSKVEKPDYDKKSVLSSMHEAVILFDKQLKIKDFNPFLYKLFDISEKVPLKEDLETLVLSLEQDEKYRKMKNPLHQRGEDLENLFNELKTKMDAFSNSTSEFKSESNLTKFVKKKTFLSTKKNRKKITSDYIKNQSLKDLRSFKRKQSDVKSYTGKLTYKSLCYLNQNGKFFKKKQKFKKTQKSLHFFLLKDLQNDISKGKSENLDAYFEFYAKSNDESKVLLVSYSFQEDAICVIMKPLEKNNTILGIWENSIFEKKLLSSMCHELKTPLNSITNMLELLSLDDSDETKTSNIQMKYLSNAIMSSKLLLCSINDFLDYFSIVSGIFESKYEGFNIKTLIEDFDSVFKYLSSKKLIEFVVDIPELDSFLCYNDANRIKQIIMNLLNNAFKFTDSGVITLKLKLRTGFYEIIVKDTGIGIDPLNLKELASFHSSKIETRQKQILVGFGLTISTHLVNYIGPAAEIMGNNIYRGIKLKTEKGKGSRFSFLVERNIFEEEGFSVPEFLSLERKQRNFDTLTSFKIKQMSCLNEESENHTPSARTEDNLCQCPKILAVDDNSFNLFVPHEQFRKHGFIIETANSGDIAISMAQKIVIDSSNPVKKFCGNCQFYKLILMDIDMPIKNGYETTREILKILKKEKMDVNIVALSAFSDKEAKEEAFKAGMVDFIEKPFSQSKMENLIEKFLNEPVSS